MNTFAVVALIAAVVHLVGWFFGARISLASKMNEMQCTDGFKDIKNCRAHHRPQCPKPLGELRERTTADGIGALAQGFFWPIVNGGHLLARTTPLTPGETRRQLAEQERRITDQAAIIARLTRQIGQP